MVPNAIASSNGAKPIPVNPPESDTIGRAMKTPDDRPPVPEASPQVQVPGYTQLVHRKDEPVDFRDAEVPQYRIIRGRHIVGFAIAATVGSTICSLWLSTLTSGTPLGGAGGAIIGAIFGGIIFGMVGVLLAHRVRPDDEWEYWRNEHAFRPYYNDKFQFERDYLPAYRFGYQSRRHYFGQTIDEAEAKIRWEWEAEKDDSQLNWATARQVISDAWARYDAKRAEYEYRPQSY